MYKSSVAVGAPVHLAFPIILLAANSLFCAQVSAQIADHTWNGGSGNWSDATKWDTGSSPTGAVNIFIDGGKSASSDVFLDVDVTINNITIDANDLLTIEDGKSMRVNGSTMKIDGLLSLQSAGVDTDIIIGGSNVVLEGSGAIELGGSPNNRIIGSNPNNVLNNEATIRGGGRIGMGTLQINNNGRIEANSTTATLEIHATSNVINTGEMLATGGGNLRLKEGSYDNTNGLIKSENNSVVELWDNAAITGGELATQGTGVVKTFDANAQTVFLKDLKNSGQFLVTEGTAVQIEGEIENDGTIFVDGNGANAILRVSSADAEITGTGVLKLYQTDSTKTAIVVGENSNSVLTIAPLADVSGSGRIDVDVINNGSVFADDPGAGKSLLITGQFTNDGLLYAYKGALIIEGKVETKKEIDALDNTYILLRNGGHVAGTSGLSGLTTHDSGYVEIEDGVVEDIHLEGDIRITGQMRAMGTVFFDDSVVAGVSTKTVVTGSSEFFGTTNASNLDMPFADHQILGDPAGTANTLKVTSLVIQGHGVVGGGTNSNALDDLKIFNDAYGTFLANRNSPLTIHTGSKDFTNFGELRANGSILEVANATGQFTNYAANQLTRGTYSVVGGGTIQIENLDVNVLKNAYIFFDGVGSTITDFQGNNAIRNLQILDASAISLANMAELRLDRSFSMTTGSRIEIDDNSILIVGTNGNLNIETTTGNSLWNSMVNGILDVGTFTNKHNRLFGSGTIDGNLIVSSVGTFEYGELNPGGEPGNTNQTGELKVTGDYSQSLNGQLWIQMGGTSFTDFDRLTISGVANLGGRLEIDFVDGFAPNFGDQFQIITTAPDGINGTFDSVSGPSGYSWLVDYHHDNVTITAMAAVPEPSTYAMMSFLAVVGLVWHRRKRKIELATKNATSTKT